MLHVVSAVVGIATAALIVFIVFGSASQNGASQDGDSGHSAQGEESGSGIGSNKSGNVGCGAYKVPANRNSNAIARARKSLPTVRNQKGVAVTPSDANQITWFATASAAAGLCMDEISVSQRRHTVTLSLPENFDRAASGRFVYAVAQELFNAPEGLQRQGIRVVATYGQGGNQQLQLIIGMDAWDHFLRERKRFGLKADIGGLYSFNRRID